MKSPVTFHSNDKLKMPMYLDSMYNKAASSETIEEIINALKMTENDTFLDFGCGKGVVVNKIAQLPIKKVIGVELLKKYALHSYNTTRENDKRKASVEIYHDDAAIFPIPKDVTVLFFNCPFLDETFKEVLKNLDKSIAENPRKVRIVFVLPENFVSQLLGVYKIKINEETFCWEYPM